MELDNLLLGELNQRMNRYRYFKASGRLGLKHLKDIKNEDLRWLWNICQSKGYNSIPYIKYYTGKDIK